MEKNNPFENKPKIVIPEIQEAITEGKNDIELMENSLKESLMDLKELIELIEMDVGYLEHMKDNNEFVEEYKNETGVEPSIKKYDDEEIAKIKSEIEKGRADIKEIHGLMTTLTLQKIATEDYVEQFQKLEESFKALISKIDSNQAN